MKQSLNNCELEIKIILFPITLCMSCFYDYINISTSLTSINIQLMMKHFKFTSKNINSNFKIRKI